MNKVFTDQMGRSVELNYPPKRIISIVPSQTELLYDLGLSEEVVGQTLFCIHPLDMHEIKPRVGGTKKLNFDRIAELEPDLIIANKEENNREQLEELMESYPVWISDIRSLSNALDMIVMVGELTGKEVKAAEIANTIRTKFTQKIPKANMSVCYLIWRAPYMTINRDTFIHDMLAHCGFKNVFAEENQRYPEVTADQLKAKRPDCIFLSSEPYPFQQKHIEELKEICPESKIILVDGELFSWYGSRLLKSVDYFIPLISQLNGV